MIKTTFNDLDTSTQEKITRLDSLEASYKKDNGNVVMYDGSKYYTAKLEVPKNKTTYFSYNEIVDMRDNLYKSNNKYKSSSDTYMTMGKVFASNFKNLLTAIEPTKIFEVKEDIVLSKTYGNFYYIYTIAGNIYKIVKNNTNNIVSMNLIKYIKENFVPSLDARDILDFLPYKDGFLLATLQNGVFYVTQSSAELKFPMNDVFRMFVLPNKNILCVAHHEKPSIVFWDFESGKKVESSNVLRVRDKQYPKDALMVGNDFCILGKPSGGNPSGNIVHYWKMDEANIGYEYSVVAPNKASIFYEVKFIKTAGSTLYISGLYKDHIFIWVYNLLDLRQEPKEFIFDKLNVSYDEFLYIDLYTNNGSAAFTFNVGERLLTVNSDMEIIENVMLKDYEGTKKIIGSGNNVVCIKKNYTNGYTRQEYGYIPNINLEITNTPCNNINVYIKSNDATERAAFFDEDTLEQIIPAYYGITSEYETIINIENCNAKRIMMKISSPKGNVIQGVVVNKNQLYIK